MIITNDVLYRESKRPIIWDAFFNNDDTPKPLVIFCHGYKGFKDWGAWNLVADAFKQSNIFFVKFNFSHNGGTIQDPIDFPDLEAFAENNYSKELDDLNDILDFFLADTCAYSKHIDTKNVTIIGHSRGGGISIIKAAEDYRITKLITWASVSGFGKRITTAGDLEQWKKDGVRYVMNGRTKQMMPHNYQFYLDYKTNEERFNIERAAASLTIPFLIIHAANDPTVSYEDAENLHRFNPNSILKRIEGSNHVFDAKHPWEVSDLPEALQLVTKESIDFIT